MSLIGLNSLETRIKILSRNCYDFKKLSVPTQTIRSLYSNACFENVFLTILIAVWNIKVFLMVYTPCFEEVYLNVRNQSGCFCETSFLKAGFTVIQNKLSRKFCQNISRANCRLVLVATGFTICHEFTTKE